MITFRCCRAGQGKAQRRSPRAARPVTSRSTRRRARLPSGSRSGSKTVTWAPVARGVRAARRSVSSTTLSPPGVRGIDGGHHARIEDVDLQMQPVAVDVVTIDDIEDPARGFRGAVRSDLCGGDDRAQKRGGLLKRRVVVAAARMGGVGGGEVRAEAIDVGDRGPVQAHRGGQIFSGQAGALVGVGRDAGSRCVRRDAPGSEIRPIVTGRSYTWERTFPVARDSSRARGKERPR
jgi:hypothetical protein